MTRERRLLSLTLSALDVLSVCGDAGPALAMRDELRAYFGGDGGGMPDFTDDELHPEAARDHEDDECVVCDDDEHGA